MRAAPHDDTATHGATLYDVKPWFVARLRPVEARAVAAGVTPAVLTWLGLACAAATAGALLAGLRWPLLWLAVPVLSLARMACNALDGAVARRTGAGSRQGAVLNELVDRGADLLTFAALAPLAGLPLAAAAVVTALTTSFVAVTGQAVTGTRIAAGPLGKPDRVAVLSGAAVAAPVMGHSAFAVGAAAIVVLGAVTVARRTVALWRSAGDQR